ncbi:TetR-like C-terminal domain-containing protein [Actinacidiphila yeochonensis]|uniref:TetR-like C-terminal domain-containing protein n=1 Tax=Actinacidiphila yeochonensis TaxID=89050 RepID=UPI002244FC21|nr:TetR-like C-terminal domain-containing protein [Actinacidiphila yeochonensis]
MHAVARAYVSWALSHPARFKLVFGRWAGAAPELRSAAEAVRGEWLRVVTEAQRAGCLPAGDPARLAALVQATAHGAADLAYAGHLSEGSAVRTLPGHLVDELLDCLEEAAGGTGNAESGIGPAGGGSDGSR